MVTRSAYLRCSCSMGFALMFLGLFFSNGVLAQAPLNPPASADVPTKDTGVPVPESSLAAPSVPSVESGAPVPPSPEDIAEGKRFLQEAMGAFPRRVLVLDDLGDKSAPRLSTLIHGAENRQGYFDWAQSNQLEWDMKLNYRRFKKVSGAALALMLSNADLIIHTASSGPWSLYRRGRKNSLQKIGESPAPPKEKMNDIVGWLFSALGWDGVVLGQKGDTLIVGSSRDILKTEGLQALAVNNSHGKWTLQDEERKGSGILSLVKTQGAFGYFDIVFMGSGVKSIPKGTKLILEKKK